MGLMSVDEIGKNISELEDRAIESSQNKTQKKKLKEIFMTCETALGSLIYGHLESLEKRREEKEGRNNGPKLIQTINTNFQEAR